MPIPVGKQQSHPCLEVFLKKKIELPWLYTLYANLRVRGSDIFIKNVAQLYPTLPCLKVTKPTLQLCRKSCISFAAFMFLQILLCNTCKHTQKSQMRLLFVKSFHIHRYSKKQQQQQ